MNETKARYIIDNKFIKWDNEGESLYLTWKKKIERNGKSEEDENISSFENYVDSQISRVNESDDNYDDNDDDDFDDSGDHIEDGDEDIIESSSLLTNKHKKTTERDDDYDDYDDDETEEYIDSADEYIGDNDSDIFNDDDDDDDDDVLYQAQKKALSSGKSLEDEIIIENGDFLKLTRKLASSPSFERSSSKNYTTTTTKRVPTVGFIMADSLIEEAFKSFYDVCVYPVKHLHLLRSKEGQQSLKDIMHDCCLKKATRDAEDCIRENQHGDMEFNSKMASRKGCSHFSNQEFSETPAKDHVSRILSILSHAENDDGIYSQIAQRAEEEFKEVCNVANMVSECSKDNEKNEYVRDIANPDLVKSSATKTVSTITKCEIDAIEKNYFFAQSVAFATWGNIALKKTPEDTSNQARNLVQKLMKWLTQGKGKSFDAQEDGVYMGYQSAVGYLISIISYLPDNFGTRDTRRNSVAKRSSLALSWIRKAIQDGRVPSEITEYEPFGVTESKKGRGRKLKKKLRKSVSTTSRILSKSELSILQTHIKECYVEYRRILAKMREEGATSVLDQDQKFSAASDVLKTRNDTRGKDAAKRMELGVFKSVIKSSKVDAYDMTIRVLALTASHIAAYSSSGYAPGRISGVEGTLSDYLSLVESRVSSVSGISPSGRKIPSTINNNNNNKKLLSSSSSSSSSCKSVRLNTHQKSTFETMLKVLDKHLSTNKNNVKGKLFTFIIPDEKKFSSESKRKRTNDYIHHFIVERQQLSSHNNNSSSNDNGRKKKVNYYYEKWKSLPNPSSSSSSLKPRTSEARFVLIFDPNSNAAYNPDNVDINRKRVTYIDATGKPNSVRMKRHYNGIGLSSPFTPYGKKSDISNIERKYNVFVDVRKSLGAIE
jgi:hypothetical protein